MAARSTVMDFQVPKITHEEIDAPVQEQLIVELYSK